MRLAIADPPYLGRANRWYGSGRGHSAGRGKPDTHPDASVWDQIDAHLELLRRLEVDYDGWAYAGLPGYLRDLEAAIPPACRRMVWHRGNAIPSGSRIRSTYEIVIVRPPDSRRGNGSGLAVDDVLHAGVETRKGFVGAKPEVWTRWVLAALGHRPGVDELDDIFAGSGAVAAATDGLLPIPA